MRRLLLVTLALTFILLIWGGVVHNTQSSLACPDWPLCHGLFFPPMKGGILIEHGHRLLGALVGLCCLFLWGWAWKDRKKTPVGLQLSSWTLFLVMLQGGLGGVTVVYKLPTIVSTLHLALAMVFFCFLIFHHHRISPFVLSCERKSELRRHWSPKIKEGIWIVVFLLYLQILLGAFVRHSGAGAACGLGDSSVFWCLDLAVWGKTLWPVSPEAKVHMLHRYLGVFLCLYSFYVCRRIFSFIRRRVDQTGIILIVVSIPILIVLQIGLGMATVGFFMRVLPTTAHLGMAAIILGLSFKLGCWFNSLEKKLGIEETHGKFFYFLQLTKPKLLMLVMMTTLTGILLASEEIDFIKALLGMMGLAMVVGGANTVNAFMERGIDGQMKRTGERPLPTGRLSPKEALYFGVFLIVSGVILLTTELNAMTAFLALFACLIYLGLYTPLKQKSRMAVFVGAVPGAIPSLLGQTMVSGTIEWLSLALFFILFMWQLPHFLAISLVYSHDYKKAGIKVYPHASGVGVTWMLILIFTVLLLSTSLLPVFWGLAGETYGKAAGILGGGLLLMAVLGTLGKRKDSSDGGGSAYGYFISTLVYLPLLLMAWVFFK